MATGVVSWSQTAATNASADSAVNFAEGQAPATVNDSARAMMASVAKWRDDINASVITGGTSTAYTLATNQGYASLAAMDHAIITFSPHVTCGASPTLAVDGLTAKAINIATGTAVPTAGLVAATPYMALYLNSSTEFILLQGGGIQQFASGTAIVFAQTAAPTGWTKSTTHNDKALRVVSGTASSGGTTAFTTVFAARTIITANLPAYTPTGTINTPTITTQMRVNKADLGAGSVKYATDLANSQGTVTDCATSQALTFTGAAQGGTATAMDFAVQYVDVIIATKD